MKKQFLFSFFICFLTTISFAQNAQEWIEQALQSNNQDKRIEYLTNAIEMEWDNTNAYFNRGNTYRLMKDYDNAIADFNTVISFDNADIDAYYLRGKTYLAMEQYQKALDDWAIVDEQREPFDFKYKNYSQTAQDGLNGVVYAIMEFEKASADFGQIQEGEKVSHTYKFTNTGKEPLVISKAKGSCGCTVPEFPKEPIAPSESGEITVVFNSKGKKGKRNQKVTITANISPAQTFIYLTGEVIPDPENTNKEEKSNPFGLDFENGIGNPTTPTPAPKATIEFKEAQIDFGTIKEGEIVHKTFTFTNTSKVPLVLKNVKSGNAYVVPTWSIEPIPPGKSGEINVEFYTVYRKGKRNQKITIFSNTEEEYTYIYLVGEVTPDPDIAAGKMDGIIQSPPPPPPPFPLSKDAQMEFQYKQFDFGKIQEGEKVSHTYQFTNTGAEPLLISNAKGSCGCTVPQFPKEPIAPGESGEITVVFNSKSKKGKRNQKVTITANTSPAQTFIYLTGEVLVNE